VTFCVDLRPITSHLITYDLLCSPPPHKKSQVNGYDIVSLALKYVLKQNNSLSIRYSDLKYRALDDLFSQNWLHTSQNSFLPTAPSFGLGPRIEKPIPPPKPLATGLTGYRETQ
jgi:hypothetical protein